MSFDAVHHRIALFPTDRPVSSDDLIGRADDRHRRPAQGLIDDVAGLGGRLVDLEDERLGKFGIDFGQNGLGYLIDSNCELSSFTRDLLSAVVGREGVGDPFLGLRQQVSNLGEQVEFCRGDFLFGRPGGPGQLLQLINDLAANERRR